MKMALGKELEEIIELARKHEVNTKEGLIDHLTDAIYQCVMFGLRPEMLSSVEHSKTHIEFYTNVIRYISGLRVYGDEKRAEVEAFLGGIGYNALMQECNKLS